MVLYLAPCRDTLSDAGRRACLGGGGAPHTSNAEANDPKDKHTNRSEGPRPEGRKRWTQRTTTRRTTVRERSRSLRLCSAAPTYLPGLPESVRAVAIAWRCRIMGLGLLGLAFRRLFHTPVVNGPLFEIGRLGLPMLHGFRPRHHPLRLVEVDALLLATLPRCRSVGAAVQPLLLLTDTMPGEDGATQRCGNAGNQLRLGTCALRLRLRLRARGRGCHLYREKEPQDRGKGPEGPLRMKRTPTREPASGEARANGNNARESHAKSPDFNRNGNVGKIRLFLNL